MQINVRLGEPLWRAAGVRRLALEWPSDRQVTVGDVLERLAVEHPDFDEAYRGRGIARAHPYRLFVDSRPIDPPPRLASSGVVAAEPVGPQLADGQTLFIVLPAIGG